jgi:hypothetical protein
LHHNFKHPGQGHGIADVVFVFFVKIVEVDGVHEVVNEGW